MNANSSRMPLLVHLVFHPASAGARELALALHRALNNDPALPGLRVPTAILPEDGSQFPPPEYRFDEAEQNVLLVLADDEMAADPLEPMPGRLTWSQFVAELATNCTNSGGRFIPFQLSESAWPLHPTLETTNFVRLQLQPEENRAEFAIRAAVVEICRYLEGCERGERLPMQLFLSHAKQDIAADPKIFQQIVEHLRTTQPVKTWIDSAEIEGGSRFDEAIRQGVRDSVVLVLATRNYSSRPWCRRELLLAKRHQRPFVIIDALEGLDLRSFPYGGNVPRLRWKNGDAQRAVDLLLKETLRHLHSCLVLNRLQSEGDTVLPAPPELATLVRLPRGSSVLYPDPPVGDEEMEQLEPLGLRIQTPLQRAAEARGLSKVPIALSISESGDCERFGLFPDQLDFALLEISRQLLVRGATLEYGGHLGPAGYTVALFDMARAYAALSGLPPAERIVNDVGWPLPLQTLSASERAKQKLVATYRRIARPAGVEALDPATFVEEPSFFPADTPERRYAWARGLTAMREFQSTSAKARIALGGKFRDTLTVNPDRTHQIRWYVGRIPGVVEEALLSIRRNQPLYLVGAFGGAAALVIDLLEGRPRPEFSWEFQKQAPHAEQMRALYERHGPKWEDYPDLAAEFRSFGVSGLSTHNGLSIEENQQLFRVRDLNRIVELLLKGLSNFSH